MEEENEITTICLKKKTKKLLAPYKTTYGSYEKAIIELINDFEHVKKN